LFRGTQRDQIDSLKTVVDQEQQIALLEKAMDGRLNDIEVLQDKLKKIEATVEKLNGELKASKKQAAANKVEAETAKKDWKLSSEQVISVRKEVSNERNAAMVLVRELHSSKGAVKVAGVHAADCDEVIQRLTGTIAREQTKFVESEAVVKSLREQLAKSEARFQRSQEEVSQGQILVKAVTSELNATTRTAKDSGTCTAKLIVDVCDTRASLRASQTEAARLDQTLDKFRKDLVVCEKDLDAEKAKVAKLTTALHAADAKNVKLTDKITDQQRFVKVLEENVATAQRMSSSAARMTEAVGRDLYAARQKKQDAESDLTPLEDASKRYIAQVADLQAKLQASTTIVDSLRSEAAANLKRAIAAEATNLGHEKVVADLSEVAANAKSHDGTASVLTTKMAHRLYEAQKRIPPLEQEVGVYKEQVVRQLEELNALKDKQPGKDAEIKKLRADLATSKGETHDWHMKVAGIEAKIPPLSEQVLSVQSQLKDELALKTELVKELYKCRKKTTEAEDQAKELTAHVQRLVVQLQSDSAEPKSPKSPKKNTSLSSPRGGQKMAVHGLLKAAGGTESLPAIGGTERRARFGTGT